MEPDLIQNFYHNNINIEEFGCKVIQLRSSDQVKELQTVIRDKSTSRSDFIFYADRLIRLVIEEGLNQLPYTKCTVITPTGQKYEGVKYCKGNCGVSIMRSGEAMEHGLRDCCRSIRIGKILIRNDEDTNEAKVYYAKLPGDIANRKVMLMYPCMNTGNHVIKALRVLADHQVEDKNIILLTLFATPLAVREVLKQHPDITVLTSEVSNVPTTHFGQKYFGTD